MRLRPSRPPLLAFVAVSGPTLLGAMLLAAPARAEGWMTEGSLAVGTGLEGGNAGTGELSWQRARIRLAAGVDILSDETPDEGFGFRGIAELERRGSIGAEARYSRFIFRSFGAYAGAIGVFTPETLLGATVGAKLVLPLGRVGLFLEPSFAALPLGSDLPEKSVLFWGLVSLGVNARL